LLFDDILKKLVNKNNNLLFDDILKKLVSRS